jgi:RHS repeat-associated protein
MRLTPARNIVLRALPLVVLTCFGITAPAQAAPGYEHPGGQQVPEVPMTRVPVKKAAVQGAKMLNGAVPDAEWPTGAAEVEVQGSAARAGALPVQVGDATSAAKVRVEFLDRAASDRAGVTGVLMRVGRTASPAASATARSAPAARVPLRIDYRKFRNSFGGDWASRLRVLALPECALTTPDAPDCAGVPVASKNDAKAGVITASVSGASTLMALSAGTSGPAGDFAATPMAPSSTWQAGGSTGDFNWSYPLRMPPALGGASPKVSFNYSSQSVDGRTSATNNQPSMLGEGFEYSPGFVERRFKSCLDDMGDGASNTKKTGDFCQSDYDNIVLSLNGSSVELIFNSDEKRWHTKKEDGTKIERLYDTALANGDDDGEYWKATTADGTQYFFGRNRLPGWTTDKPETKSAWTVPVAGNHSGEKCRKDAFVDSFCDEAWRWNLDYIVDANQNTTSFWYAPETNYYGRNNDATKRSKYTRGGMLSRIDYGTRTGDIFGTAPAQVVFEPADRCSTTSNCDATVKENWKNWLDTPLDKGCKEGTDCKDNFAPTFWSTKRLAKVTTQVWGGSAYRKVDQWTLRVSWPQPTDGTHTGMWLAGITHTGLVGTPITLPETVLTGTKMNNRVDTASDNIYAYAWMRLTSIQSESGGLTSVFYSDPECVAGSKVPTDLDDNKLRCYPVKWQPEGAGSDITDYFHKYVVRAVTETDLTGGSPPVKTVYEYLGSPAWHYDEYNGLTKKSRLTWGQWRGYEGVRVLRGEQGEQTRTETTYFRGMDGDEKSGGGKREVTLPQIDNSPAIADADAWAGMVREERTYNDDQLIAATVSTPWQSAATATRTISGQTTEARYIGVGATRTRTKILPAGTWRRVTSTSKFDDYGMVVEADDTGDEAVVGSDTVVGDERCVKTTYARNSTTWIMDRISKIETYARPCAVAPKTADDVIGITRNYYDGAAAAGAAPTGPGVLTKTETLATWSSATSMTFATQQRAHYDEYGRTDQVWDKAGLKKTTAYTAIAGGGVTKVTTTTVADSKFYTTSTEVDPAWGVTTASVDMNGNRTEATFDALGRTAAVWQPGRSRSASANAVFSYVMRQDGVISTKAQTLNAAGKYVISYTLYDSLLRQRQTQGDSPTAGSRIVTETRYDTAGRAVLQLGPIVNGNPPSQDLSTVEADLVYEQSSTRYDQAGRVTAKVFQPRGTEKWRTTTKYFGDRIETVPPAGGTASTVVDNATGKTIALKQYPAGGSPDSGTVTSYSYNRKGELQTVTAPGGSKWEYKRDLRGRLTLTKDPDKGEVSYGYDAYDRLTTVSDARGAAAALKYTYDSLGRKLGIYDRATNAKRATWTYDTAPGGKGAVATSSRWIGTAEYKTTVRGYSPRGLSTGTVSTLPSTEGPLAGDYTFIIGYNDSTNGSVSGYTYGGRADLAAETIFYNYDQGVGLPYSMDSDYPGTNAYVKSTSYTGTAKPSGFVLTTDKRGTVETYRDYTYDLATGRIDHSTTSASSKGVISQPYYTYNDAGAITKITDALPGAGGRTDTQCFAQDYLQRLTEAWTPSDGDCDPQKRSALTLGGPAPYWQSWTYDDSGNRKSQTEHRISGDAVTDYQMVPGKHALASTTGEVTGTYEYDEIGNLERRPTGTGDQSLTWDPEGHLASITEGGNTTTFVYDAGGTRLLRKDPLVTTLYLGDVEIRLTKATGAMAETRGYKWADQTVALRTAAGVVWLVNDHQGTANILIEATSQRVLVRHQTPFGGPRGPVSPWPNQRGFLGGQQDPSGMTHLGAREYDPVTGRFTSVDPILDTSDPQQMNGYSYANNNPISSCDPSGERPLYDDYGAGGVEATGGSSGSSSSGGQGGGGAVASKKDDNWWREWKLPHDAAVKKRVEQIKLKWPKARKITVTMGENFVREGSSKNNGKPGYADLVCWDCDAGKVYVWEMKHKGGDAESGGPAQLQRYVDKLEDMGAKDPKHGAHGKSVEKGPRFGKAMDTTTPNPANPKQTVYIEDGAEDGIQVYYMKDNDDESEPSPTPTPTATSTPGAEPTVAPTDFPHPRGRTPTPSPTTRAPELPKNDGIRVEAPDLETVTAAVQVTAVVAITVVACVTLAPVVAAAVAVAAVSLFAFGW